ncbi:hypothetical protein [Vibrio parahaemolyticus]|uniref:hypothetical protein n=1 Tax=Vibrio parahaemolyticus TaxID=670 RepID=UPI002F869573
MNKVDVEGVRSLVIDQLKSKYDAVLALLERVLTLMLILAVSLLGAPEAVKMIGLPATAVHTVEVVGYCMIVVGALMGIVLLVVSKRTANQLISLIRNAKA